jgi:LuxR family transcriptional regulator
MNQNAGLTITNREREVLHWVSRGKTKSEIAAILEVSESAIKRHCESIFKKLEVNNLAFAVAKALKLGLIDF